MDTSKPDDFPHFVGRWVRAEVHRDRGDIAAADKEFRWFVRTYTDRSNNDNDVAEPQELLLIGLAGCENARWHHLPQQFTFILQDETLYTTPRRTRKSQGALWQAEYQAVAAPGEYRPTRRAQLFDSMAINPRRRSVGGKGKRPSRKWRSSKPTISRTRRSRSIRAAGLLLQGRRSTLRRRPERRFANAEKALAVNPRDEHALARKAACLEILKNKAGYDAVVRTL